MYRIVLILVLIVSAASIAHADIDEAYSALEKGNNTQAFSMFRHYAERGDAEAQYVLGTLYYDGTGVTQDFKQAAKWIQIAAEQGRTEAQLALGNLYFDGEGVTQDYEAAVRWYLLAAKKGNADAQFNMGYMYEYGFGVAKDCAVAQEWYGRAASQGDEEAQALLENFICRDFTYVASLDNGR
jgi:TPR repeat protein